MSNTDTEVNTSPQVLRRRADDLLDQHLRTQGAAIDAIRDDQVQFRSEHAQQIADIRHEQAAIRESLRPLTEWTSQRMERAAFWRSAREKGMLTFIGVVITVFVTFAFEVLKKRFSL